MARAIKEVAAEAKDTGVTLLIETNGVYSDTKRLRALLDKVNCREVAALWDIHHPYRFAHETPETTIENLGSYIKYVHVKDSIMEKGQDGKKTIKYRMMGFGDMPIPGMLHALREIGYEGYISLEWVKRWAPEIDDCGIVFPQFANYMREHTEEIERFGHTSFSQDHFIESINFDKFEIEFLREKHRSADPRNDFGSNV